MEDQQRKSDRVAAEAARVRAEEQARLRAEEERRKAEQARVDSLVRDADDWEHARRIRRYLQAAENALLARHGRIEPDSPAAKYLSWARDVAMGFDPLAKLYAPPTPVQAPAEASTLLVPA